MKQTFLHGSLFNTDITDVGQFSDDPLLRLQFLITTQDSMVENYKSLSREIQQALAAIPIQIIENSENKMIRDYYLENPKRRSYSTVKEHPSLSGASLDVLAIQLLSLRMALGLY
jgi:hypothetical protein